MIYRPFLIILLFLSIGASFLPAQYLPHAYWRFESPNPQADASGNGYNISDTIYLGNTDPLAGTYYDVPDSFVSLATFIPGSLDDPDFLREQLSLEFWYRRKKGDTHGKIFWGNKGYFAFSEASIQFRVAIEPTGARDVTLTLNQIGVLDINNTFDENWHHYVGTYDIKTGEQRIWIDGISEGPMRVVHGSSGRIRDGADLELSEHIAGGRMEGDFDEVAVYDTIIPRELIRLHFLQAGDSGLAYSFIAPPSDPEHFPEPITEQGTNPLDFGPNYPNVQENPLDLLSGYPLPRYRPGHNTPRLVPWLADAENRNTLGHGGTDFIKCANMELSLQHLMEDYNYFLFLGLVEETWSDIMDTAFAQGEESWHYIKMANDPAFSQYPKFMFNNWRNMRAEYLDPTRPDSTYILLPTHADSAYHIRAGGLADPKIYFFKYGFRFNIASAGFPNTHPYMDSIAFDGQVYGMMLDQIYPELLPQNRAIDMIGENDETARPLESGLMMLDSRVIADMGGLNQWGQTFTAGQYRAYDAMRNLAIRERYMEGWRNKIDSVNTGLGVDTTAITWYDLDAMSWTYDTMRTILSDRDERLRPTPHFYPQQPSRVWNSVNNLQGLDRMFSSMSYHFESGDSLFNPAVSPGYNDRDEEVTDIAMVRPGHYLGALKTLAMIGADRFSFFMYHGNTVPSQPNWRTWKLAMPAYAQALISRDSIFWYQGRLLLGDTYPLGSNPRQTWYNFETSSTADIVTVRKPHQEDRYLINGFSTKLNNAPSAGVREKDICFSLHDTSGVIFDSIALEIRTQGSTYILDFMGGDTVFYQLDSWHENKDPWHWCRDFAFEAEVFDTVIGSWDRGTDRDNPAFPGDFRDFITYLELDSGSQAIYEFQPRHPDQDSLRFWVKAWADTGTGSLEVRVDNQNAQVITGIGPFTGTATDWYQATVFYTGLGTAKHDLQVSSVGNSVKIDKVGMFRTNIFWPSVPPIADVRIDTTGGTHFCLGDTVDFLNFSKFSGICTQHFWDFGDGTKSYEIAPSHLYSYPGTYQVVYQLDLDCAEATDFDTLTVVISAPVVDAGPDQMACSSDSIRLLGVADSVYVWSFDTTLSDTTVLDPWAVSDTTITYYLTATDSNGCSLTDSVAINLVGLPEPEPVTQCITLGQSVALTPDVVGAGFLWIYPLSISGQTNPSLVVSPSLDTPFRYLTWDACNCDTVSGLVTVNVDTLTALIVTSPQTICPGDTVTLEAEPGFDAYEWSPQPGLGGPLLPTFSAVPAQTTEYFLEVDDSARGCVLYDTLLVTVDTSTLILTIPDTVSLCYGDTVELSATGSGIFNWFPATNLSSATQSTVNAWPRIDETITVTLVQTTGGPTCTYTDTVYLDVDSNCCQMPHVDFPLHGDSASSLACNPCSGIDFYVRDTFWVDTTLTLSNCVLGMDSLAVIYVEPGETLSLDGTQVYAACGILWQSIYLADSTSVLILDGQSNLRDGVYAVHAHAGGEVQASKTTFDDNWIGIHADAYAGNLPLQVTQCVFGGSSFLLPPYDNQVSEAGIWLDEIGFAQIGGPVLGNEFKRMGVGIIASYSNVSIDYNTFGAMTLKPDVKGRPGENGYGSGVYGYGVNDVDSAGLVYDIQVGLNGNSFTFNHFMDLTQGILVRNNVNLNARNNYFTNVIDYGVRVQSCYRNTIEVDSNTISGTRYGIWMNMNLGSVVRVEDNDIDHAGTAEGIGIVINDLDVYNNTGNDSNIVSAYVIRGNKVQADGECMSLRALGGLTVAENRLITTGVWSLTGTSAGIVVASCTEATFEENEITNWIGSSQPGDGILLQQSPGCYLRCNDITGYETGLHTWGSCLGAELVANEFIGNGVGVLLENNGSIGQQGTFNDPLRNEWKDLSGQGLVCQQGVGPFATSTVGTNGFQSQFVARVTSSIEYPLTSCHSGNVPILFSPANPNGGASNICQSPNGGGNGDYPKRSVKLIAKDRINYISLGAETRYQDEQFALAMLDRNLAWRQNNASLDAYYLSKQGAAIDQIKDGQKLICSRSLDGIPTECGFTPGNTIEQNYQTVLEVLHRMDGDSISFGDSLLLETIAANCPLEHGATVYQAQTLLQMLDPTRIFTNQTCLGGNKTAEPKDELMEDHAPMLKVYPNPSSGIITFDPGGVPTWIELLDSRGVTLERWTIRTEVDKDLSYLAKGLYLLRFQQGNSSGLDKVILE